MNTSMSSVSRKQADIAGSVPCSWSPSMPSDLRQKLYKGRALALQTWIVCHCNAEWSGEPQQRTHRPRPPLPLRMRVPCSSLRSMSMGLASPDEAFLASRPSMLTSSPSSP